MDANAEAAWRLKTPLKQRAVLRYGPTQTITTDIHEAWRRDRGHQSHRVRRLAERCDSAPPPFAGEISDHTVDSARTKHFPDELALNSHINCLSNHSGAAGRSTNSYRKATITARVNPTSFQKKHHSRSYQELQGNADLLDERPVPTACLQPLKRPSRRFPAVQPHQRDQIRLLCRLSRHQRQGRQTYGGVRPLQHTHGRRHISRRR